MDAASLNPYAPPSSALQVSDQIGEVFRSKKLIRLDRHGQLPERCIRCNAPGSGERFSRKLLWSPLAWRMALLLSVPAFIGLANLFDSALMALLFWPMMFLLLIVHLVVRKPVAIELAVCVYHRRLHNMLLIGSVMSLIATMAAIFVLASTRQGSVSMLLVVLIPAMLVFEMVRRSLGPLAVRVARLDTQHIWLGGSGRKFRESLPELS